MKKFFGTLWSVLRYVLIYIGCGVLTGLLLEFYFLRKFNMDMKQANMVIDQIPILIIGYLSLLSLVFFLIVIKVCHKKINGFLKFKKISSKDALNCIGISVAYSFFSVSFIYLTSSLFPSYGEVNSTIHLSIATLIGVLLVILLIPVFEEIFFRGIIFNELRMRVNFTASVIIQAFIFGLFHGNILQGIYTFFIAIIMALVYTWTGSLWSNIIMHTSYNFLGISIVPIIVALTPSYIILYLLVGGGAAVALTRNVYLRKKEENRKRGEVIVSEAADNSFTDTTL